MDYIEQIQTSNGPTRINYNALANLPTSDMTLSKKGAFADALIVGQKFMSLTNQVDELTKTVSALNDRIAALESK